MSRFQAGGTVRRDSLYIKRSADQDLPQALLHGQLCYVLAPRQMGKSSLSARVEETLRQDGVRCATLDLIPFASAETTQEEWYSSLIVELGGQLLLADPLQQWKRLEGRAPALRWFHFLRDEVIARIAERVVIFIDEIDAILNLPPWRSDFLIGIQSLYNARHRDPACQRLTFCLSGVARPLDLSADPAKAAFTIGR